MATSGIGEAMPARAVLFDLDGTLVDSTKAMCRSWVRWCTEFGVDDADFRRAHAHGRPASEVIADLVPAVSASAALRRIEELEVTDVDGVVTLPGARELLSRLPPRQWAVVTSCTAPLAVARLQHTGIAPPELVTASDVTDGKPSPEPYLLAADRLSVPPEDCIVIEDAPTGLRSARAAGMRAIAVTTTHHAADLSDATEIIDALTALTVEADGALVIHRDQAMRSK